MVEHEHLYECIHLLRELDDGIAGATQALAHSDLDALFRTTERQQQILQALRAIYGHAYEEWEQGAPHHVLRDEFREACVAVARRNRVHGALLRRARFTLDIFVRLLSNATRADGTYVV